MNCIKAQSMITPFINNKLSVKELEEFLDHVDSCPNCREELEVYYALLTAMKQLDEDKNVSGDFEHELAHKLEKAHERIIHVKYTYYRKKTVLIFTMICLVFLLSFSYANKGIDKLEDLIEDNVEESDFHLRIVFRDPRNKMLELKLEDYFRKQEQLNVPSQQVAPEQAAPRE